MVIKEGPLVRMPFLRYDGATGAFIDQFVATRTAGLDDPRGMTFGPDGSLYVASRITDQVLRFDGTTGAFTDVFVSVGSGGLDKPFNMDFGADGNLYVVSRGTDSIKRFSGATGEYIDDFVASGSGGLSGPRDLEFGIDGLTLRGQQGKPMKYYVLTEFPAPTSTRL